MKRIFALISAVATTFCLSLTAPVAAQDDPVDGIFASSAASMSQLADIGVNTVTTNANVRELNAAAEQGLRSVVWLGGYTNAPICQFVEDDQWVINHVNAIKRHLAIVAYQIDNEPHATGECPNAPQQIRDRAALVRSLDPNPNHLTLLSLYREYDFDEFANATDVLRVGMYPCSHAYGCVYSRITNKVAAARAAGWTGPLWGSPQAFGNDYYRMPTLDEAQRIRQTWRNAGVTNLLAYQWDHGEPDVLLNHPGVWPAFGD